MRMPYLNSVPMNRQSKNLDFSKDLSLSLNVQVVDGKIEPAPRFIQDIGILPAGLSCLKLYSFSEEMYAYMSDCKVYKFLIGQFVQCCSKTFYEPPVLVPITYNGYAATLILGGQSSILIGKDSEGGDIEQGVNVPNASSYLVYAGMLFLGQYYKLYFSEPYDYTSVNTQTQKGGLINIDREAGIILALCKIKSKMYVICERKIFHLSPFGEKPNFELKEVPTSSLQINQTSIASTPDKVVFINQGKLSYFDGQKINVVSSLLESKMITTSEQSCCQYDRYLIPVTVEGVSGSYVYAYDFYTNSEFIIDNVGLLGSANGLACNHLDGFVYKLSVDGKHQRLCNSYCSFDNVNLSNGIEEKFLCEIRAQVNGKAIIKISGDFGTKSFALSKGYNKKFCNLKSSEFKIELISTARAFSVSDLQLIYE